MMYVVADEAGVSSGSESSVACAVAAAGAAGGGGGGACSAQRAPVPTISVTPHSPGILDEPLQQLQRIHQAVQRMRHQAFTPQVYPLSLITTHGGASCVQQW